MGRKPSADLRGLWGVRTPGPWEAIFEGASGPCEERWRVISPAALTVATVAPGRCAEGNALLLAAAPALFDALLAVTTALEEWAEGLSDTNQQARLALLAEARRALAQAAGDGGQEVAR